MSRSRMGNRVGVLGYSMRGMTKEEFLSTAVYEGEYEGYTYYIRECSTNGGIPVGGDMREWLAGYVLVDEGFYLTRKLHRLDEFRVDGGITFGEEVRGLGYLIGFDCNISGEVEKGLDYVIAECESLIRQVAQMMEGMRNARNNRQRDTSESV